MKRNKIGNVFLYSLGYAETAKFFFTPILGVEASRWTKGITNVIMSSKATMVSKVTVTIMLSSQLLRKQYNALYFI